MKSLLTILSAVFLSLLAAFYITPKQNAPVATKPNALQRILERGVLRCGYASFAPMLIIDPNTKQLSGIAHDIMEEVGKKLGVKIEWSEESGWGEFVTALNNERFDMFCTGNWANSKRARLIAFTNPIAYSPLDVFVRADDMRFDGDIGKLNDPAIKLVNIEGGTTIIVTAESFPQSKHYELPELSPITNLFIEVTGRKADAALMDRATGFNFMKHNPDQIKRVEVSALRAFANVYSLNQGETELQQAVNEALRELYDAGIAERIIQQYEPLPNAYYRVAPGYLQK